MTSKPNPLGDYLRARRGLVSPADVGIPDVGVRRVPGLRREEVAMLAGISADYYLRLERGRDRNPSVQVLEAIARVLRLDDAHLAHLVQLGAPSPARRRRRAPKETVPSGMLALLDSLAQPAFIEGRYFDILAANPLAVAISPRLAVGGNQLRDLFLEPGEQELYSDLCDAATCMVASLRQAVGNDVDDPRFIELVGELTLASPQFAEMWARHDVRAQYGGTLRLEHPQVGLMTLNRERLSINGAEHLNLVVLHATAGTADAEKLALLASAALPSAERAGGREGARDVAES